MAAPLTRGVQFIAYVEVLRAWGELDRVVDAAAAATRPLMRALPRAAEWLPLQHNVDLFVAVDAALGPGRARAVTREASRRRLTDHVGPLVQLALSTFGVSPATLLTRGNLLLRFSIRDQELTYTPWTPTSGALEIRVLGLRPPPVFYEAWAGVVEHALDLCGASGTVAVHRREERGENGVGVLRVAWTA